VSEYELEVSNSDIQMFKQCRRRWWLASYRRLHPKGTTVTGPLALGSRVHAALEAYYTDHRDPVDAHAELLQADRETLVYEGRDITELENEGELGRIMLEGYMEWVAENGLDSGIEVIGSEQVISCPIEVNGSKVLLKGKIDMRIRRLADGNRFFVDFKTSANFADLTRLAHMDEQLKFYQMLESMQHDDDGRVEGAIFRILKKVKRSASARPPFYEQVEIRNNKRAIRNFWDRTYYTVAQMLDLKKALDSGVDPTAIAYPTPSRDCSWKCPFVQVCPMFDDGSNAEQMLEDLFEEHDPHERYRTGGGVDNEKVNI
jgi:RecB family exonuclease